MKNISLKSILLITLGNLIFAISVNLFLVANHMGEGGVTGLSILVYYLTNIPIDITYFSVNAILLILGYKYLDKSTVGYTIYSLVMFTIFVRLTAEFNYQFENVMLVPIVNGVLGGASVGIILLAGGSTAGTDIVALFLNKFLNIPLGIGIFIVDMFIIIPSSFVIGFEKTLYTIIMLYISIKVIDYILEGLDPKKSIMIISTKYEDIAKEITEKVERGITVLHGQGYYTKQEKRILYVIVSRREVINITKIINHIDSKAFVTISNVSQVTGEGFTFHLPDQKTLQ